MALTFLGVIASLFWLANLSSAQGSLNLPEFTEAIPQGFGDRQNSYTWSMAWWHDKLYIGTGRSVLCVQHATGHLYYPIIVSYPPQDPDIECTPDSRDLPLQAEIWRWLPETNTWERLFQSPEDIEIPDSLGYFVARDIGFRSMTVFTEPDGTEALYVAGVSSNSFNLGAPPPRILRSTDGVNFEPLPQGSGTFLGDLEASSFRSLTSYQGKLYVIATTGFAGFGPVLEADNPALGNDNFHYALPETLTAFELATFDDYLYIGTGGNAFVDPNTPPFEVLKTDASGTPPYSFTTVIADGGHRAFLPSRSVVSMHVFKDQLYVGTDRPAELYRINADDSWDLIVGAPRQTPNGTKAPLSGMDAGFDNSNNIHVWRMQSYKNQLYVGTMDQSTKWRHVPILGEQLKPEMGFDLYTTSNGQDFVLITHTGFDDIFDVGLRNFAATPYGLFFGTANQYYGTKIWRTTLSDGGFTIHLPLLVKSAGGQRTTPGSVAERPSATLTSLAAPGNIIITDTAGGVLLSWDPSPHATLYRIWRADYRSNRQLRLSYLEADALIPGPYQEIGQTDSPYFVDRTIKPEVVYHYFIQAESAGGLKSGPSALARFPSLAPSVTLHGSDELLTGGTKQRPAQSDARIDVAGRE